MTAKTKTKTVRPAPENVQNFIRSATAAQRLGFLAKGEPQCIKLDTMREGNFETVLLPGIRGVIVGKAVESAEAALTAAAVRLAEFQADETREDVNEASLGIDQASLDLVADFEEVGCRIDQIFHLGTMAAGDVSNDLIETLADVAHGNNKALLADLPALKSVLRKSLKKDEREEELHLMIHDNGVFGFIVGVSLPLHEPTGNGTARIHMGIRHTEYRYGHTYEIACQRALEWAREERERMMSIPVEKSAA